jgi:probable addiction module antidote protein
MAIKTKLWDAAEFLKTPAHRAAYLEAAIEDGDPAVIANALGNIARAQGIAEVAKKAGVTRAALYKNLSQGGDPRISTLLGVMRATGLRVTIAPDQEAKAKRAPVVGKVIAEPSKFRSVVGGKAARPPSQKQAAESRASRKLTPAKRKDPERHASR